VKAARGFSMIELVMAIFLLAIGITLIAYLFPLATRGQGRSRVVTTSLFWAQECIERALIWGEGDIPADLVHPQDPTLVAHIDRRPWSHDARFSHIEVTVRRVNDARGAPIVRLEVVDSRAP